MAKIATSISIDAEVKERAIPLLSELGLDLSTAVGMFLRQTIRERAIPFDVSLNVPNSTTIAALEEFEEMRTNPQKYKHYSNFTDVLTEVLGDA